MSSFPEIDRLVSEQKFAEAADRAAELRLAAEVAGDAAARARALVTEVQLRLALGGFEESVELLRGVDTPARDREPILELLYAQTLLQYLQHYSWEIRQRERVASAAEGPLDTWTADQISAQADRAYLELWQGRGQWGERPLGGLAQYFDANNYPGRIRGTLRDAVVYLWAELLADSSHWTPTESNGVFRLDPQELLGSSSSDEERLADPAAHPLERLAALLREHEAWHRGAGRPEAAFEARRVLDGYLRNTFERPEDREAVTSDLTRAADELGRRYEWWSLAQADLAEWHRQGEEPEALVAARALALEGWQAHPESIGGRRCHQIVAQIEAPSYSLAAMATDAPGQRSIQIEHRNLPRLFLRAWALDLFEEVLANDDYSLLPNTQRAEQLLRTRPPDAEWTVDLPETPDYRSHRTFVTPPLDRPGLHLVVASGDAHFGNQANELQAVDFIVGDLVLLLRFGEGSDEVTVRSGASGQPVEGVQVQARPLAYRGERTAPVRAATDREGVARLELVSGLPYVLLARKGEQVAIDPRIWSLPRTRRDREPSRVLLYTDRSIYRPEQELLWKVVAYRGVTEEGRFRIDAGTELRVELRDPNGEVVGSTKVKTNAFGSASGSFEIPTGRLLGQWEVGTRNSATSIRVEEYKRPTFEVTLLDPEQALRLNRPAALSGEVRYYFGLPVVTGDVEWRVSREPVYPRWWFWQPPSRTETVAAGDAALDEEGRFRVEFTPEADEREAGSSTVSYRYRLSVDVTAEGGETRSASRTFRLGFVAVEARLDPAAAFFVAGEPVEVEVRRQDLDGSPRGGVASWTLLALEQPAATSLPADLPPESEPAGYQTPGDRLRPRWDTGYTAQAMLRSWEDGAEVARGEVEHGEDGVANLEIASLRPGAYRLRYTTCDEFGALFESQAELLVAGGEGGRLALPALLLAEHPSVPVGERIRLLVHSGLAEQPLLFEAFRSGERLDRRVLQGGGSPQVVELPATPAERGGLAFRLTALRDHQLMVQTDSVFVPWDDRKLAVEFETFRDRLRPGAKERWRVRLSGEEGPLAAGSAELLAYMYDRSLDLFAPHVPADPLDLYPRTTQLASLSANLGTAPQVWMRSQGFTDLPEWPHLRGDRLTLFDTYGIGGPGRRFGRIPTARDPWARLNEVAVAAPMRMEASADEVALEGAAEALPAGAVAKAAPEPGRGEPEEEPAVELRSDFSETAFWEPHLVLGEDGSVAFEFETPDSVTDWSVWVHALTTDLRAGSVNRTTKTVKDLLVRPYLPRFLREGDRATLRVVVNNAGEKPLAGRLDFDLVDPETEESVLADFGLKAAEARGLPFEVAPGKGTDLAFEVTAPNRVGSVAVRVSARAGDLSDGELRPLPILPSRIHLAQSRFVVLGRSADSKELRFADLAADDDPSRIDEQLVVTLDGQLFYGVLRALPYLVDYPYECTEQLLNRFVSTGVVASLYDDYPAVATMAKSFAERETVWEAWDADDPNRRMALEETPWLREARGGPRGEDLPEGVELVKVLDPAIARATRDSALAKLEKAQTSSGGFPWWPGGPPSPYMTLYLLQGFSRALEHGVEVPQPMVESAWRYIHRYYVDDLVRESIGKDCCWESVTLLNYILSSYPDADWTGGVFSAGERRRMLDFSFKHWREHSPLLKAALALTLGRSGRGDDAQLVLDSILDSAKTDDQLGTYWAQEDRSWLWYNDTIETHAYILRALTELDPDDARRHGLVQWLFLNKKLNHWKSTRATAEVIYALVHYLEHEGTLGAREEATVKLGPWARRFAWEPDSYGPAVPHGEVIAGPPDPEGGAGRPNQIVVSGDAVDPSMATVTVEKETPGPLFASATWHFSTERLPEEAQGDFFQVERVYFKRVLRGDEWTLEPLAEGARIEVGDQVQVELRLRSKHAAEYVHLRDPRGAGFEPESFTSGYKWDLGIYWYEEIRDSGTNFFFEWLPVGEYRFHYRLRATTAGTFRIAPATIQPMYAPEFNAYSAGAVVGVEE